MIELIPAIDLIEGKCVRLTKGDYSSKKIYNEDPLEVVKMLEDHGIKRLHLVDLDGAKAGHIINHKVLERIATKSSLTIDFGGGIKHDEDLRIAFDCGASMITGGSVAVKNPELFKSWLKKYGNDRIILGADCIDGKIAICGWEETTSIEIISFIKNHQDNGIKRVICTDISKDGMLQGPAINLYKDIMARINDIHLTASGGVCSIDDIENLNKIGVSAVVFGKAIYEGKIKLRDLLRFT